MSVIRQNSNLGVRQLFKSSLLAEFEYSTPTYYMYVMLLTKSALFSLLGASKTGRRQRYGKQDWRFWVHGVFSKDQRWSEGGF